VTVGNSAPIASNTLTVTLVTAMRLTHALYPIDQRGTASAQTAVLQRIHCAPSMYQGLKIISSVLVSDGASVQTGQADTSYSLPDASVLTNIGSGRFVGKGVGTQNITVSYKSLRNDVTVTVNPSDVFITQLEITPMPSNSFSATPLSTSLLRVKLTLSDGEIISDAISNFYAYSPGDIIGSLLRIESNRDTAIRVLSNGRIQLLANSNSLVSITASRFQTACTQPTVVATGIMQTNANVMPAVQGDVDLGALQGVAITTLQATIDTSIPIRILSTTNSLRGFSIVITYDSSVVKNTACTLSPAWTGACNVNVAGEVSIAGINTMFPSSSDVGGIEVATIKMQAHATGLGVVTSAISGTVSEIRVKDAGIVLNNAAFIVGNVPILIDTGSPVPGARRLVDNLESTRRSVVQQALPGPAYGDTNGDGVFTLADLIFLQEYYNSATILGCPATGGDVCIPRANIGNWQLQQLAPIGESSTGARDIPYIIGVFLGNLYFVANVSITTDINTIDANVRLVDKNNVPVSHPDQARVLYVLNTSQQVMPWKNAVNASYDTEKVLSSESNFLLFSPSTIWNSEWHGVAGYEFSLCESLSNLQ
jgi:hypothetical protein